MWRELLLVSLVPVAALRMQAPEKKSGSFLETHGMGSMSHQSWSQTCLAKSFDLDMNDDGPCQPAKPMMSSFLQGGKSRTTDAGVDLVPWLESCNEMVRPLSDFDEKAGHGNAECRYEPPKSVLEKFRKEPEDIAILAPFLNNGQDVPEDTDQLHTVAHFGVHAWRAYARHHNYSFYTGTPSGPDAEALCPGLEHRAPHWMKPCAAINLMNKHKYLIIVDTDTYATKPRLRLEPLFATAGLLDDSTGKTIAVAKEWGSCMGGHRNVISGESNTGIIMLKRHDDTLKALKNWFNEPMQCTPKDESLLEFREVKDREGYRGYGLIPGNWLGADPNPERCKVLISLLRGWSWDQASFHLTIVDHPDHKHLVSQLPAGCPMNSPWADWIPHLVGGTVSDEYYVANDRTAVFRKMQKCTAAALEQTEDDYKRCAICDLLPDKLGNAQAWSISCPKQSKKSFVKFYRTAKAPDSMIQHAKSEEPEHSVAAAKEHHSSS